LCVPDLCVQIEVKRAQPKGRERDQEQSRRGYDRQQPYAGTPQGGYPPQNGFGMPAAMGMNPMYGGMSPAMMAQLYQRMQSYYAAAMGRGMMPMGAQPMMGMPMQPNMMPMQGNPYAAMQGYPVPPQQQYQQEPSQHEGEYTYDTIPQEHIQGPPSSQSSPPPQSMEMMGSSGGHREGPPPNAPTGPSGGVKPGGGYGRGTRGSMRGARGGGPAGYSSSSGYPSSGGMPRGGNVRYNPYAR
jgi:hypothetical protein